MDTRQLLGIKMACRVVDMSLSDCSPHPLPDIGPPDCSPPSPDPDTGPPINYGEGTTFVNNPDSSQPPRPPPNFFQVEGGTIFGNFTTVVLLVPDNSPPTNSWGDHCRSETGNWSLPTKKNGMSCSTSWFASIFIAHHKHSERETNIRDEKWIIMNKESKITIWNNPSQIFFMDGMATSVLFHYDNGPPK
jgi:hypothetical protein